jgi:L-ectoine synthase
MKVIRIHEVEPVKFTGGLSFRPVVEKDGMGFSVHKTVIPVGGPHKWHYKHHLEACYCVRGRGILTNLKTGVIAHITPDVVYLLDEHDEHTFEAIEDTVLISIFNPPCKGNETHDANGNYSI